MIAFGNAVVTLAGIGTAVAGAGVLLTRRKKYKTAVKNYTLWKTMAKKLGYPLEDNNLVQHADSIVENKRTDLTYDLADYTVKLIKKLNNYRLLGLLADNGWDTDKTGFANKLISDYGLVDKYAKDNDWQWLTGKLISYLPNNKVIPWDDDDIKDILDLMTKLKKLYGKLIKVQAENHAKVSDLIDTRLPQLVKTLKDYDPDMSGLKQSVMQEYEEYFMLYEPINSAKIQELLEDKVKEDYLEYRLSDEYVDRKITNKLKGNVKRSDFNTAQRNVLAGYSLNELSTMDSVIFATIMLDNMDTIADNRIAEERRSDDDSWGGFGGGDSFGGGGGFSGGGGATGGW